MKFGIEGLHTMLLSVCEFRENRRREGRNFVMGLNVITFTRVLWKPTILLKGINPWSAVKCVLRHGGRRLRVGSTCTGRMVATDRYQHGQQRHDA
jgi:hypothetical protein